MICSPRAAILSVACVTHQRPHTFLGPFSARCKSSDPPHQKASQFSQSVAHVSPNCRFSFSWDVSVIREPSSSRLRCWRCGEACRLSGNGLETYESLQVRFPPSLRSSFYRAAVCAYPDILHRVTLLEYRRYSSVLRDFTNLST